MEPVHRRWIDDGDLEAPFDASYGYSRADLLAVEPPSPVPGFEELWRSRRRAALAVDPAPELGEPDDAALLAGPVLAAQPSARVLTVRHASTGGVRIGGWLVLPERPVRSAVVVSHGYGGRPGPDPTFLGDDVAAIFTVARGLPAASAVPGIPGTAADHVLHGIGDAESYVIGGCVQDVWCAATVLVAALDDRGERPERLSFAGASFGGGIGAFALAFDDRFDAGVLEVPTFGHQRLRLTLPCTGSGESVRRYSAEHPEVVEVLDLHDSAVAARFVEVPVLVRPALWDPAVPPPGQFAVANALPQGDLHVASAGHVAYPTQEQEDRDFVSVARQVLHGQPTMSPGTPAR